MPSMDAIVDGWRCRISRTWYPTAGGWIDCSSDNGNNHVVSCPTTNTGEFSKYAYTVIIKVTMPSNSNIDSINSITISTHGYDINTTSGTMYGSLRTVDDSTDAQYSISDYRTYVAGGSAEQSVIPTSAANTYYMTFTGNFTPGASYYLWLYTKSTSDRYHLTESSTEYNCSIEYTIKTYRVSYNANGGYNAPSYTDYEYNDTCTVSSITPTKNPVSNSNDFTITGNANGGDKNTSITATKTETTNYTFNGWATSNSATVAEYVAGSTFDVTDDITLYAVWSSSMETSYSNNTLANLPQPTHSPSNASYVLKLNPDNGDDITSKTVEKSASYTFSGWSLYTNGTMLSTSSAFYTDTVVYAIWDVDGIDTSIVTLPTPSKSKSVTGSYSITLNTNGGSVTNSILTANINAVYTFVGWSTTSSAADIVGSPYTVNSNITLTAIWDQQYQTDGVYLPSATKDGYSFIGWSMTADSTDYAPNPFVPISNTTLYANYKVGRGIKAFLWHDNNWYRIMVDGL